LIMKIKYCEIPLLSYKNVAIGIPIVEVGDMSSGFCVLVCQLHGDEFSSWIIAKNLLEQVQSQKTNLGIKLILSANPYGATVGVKNEPVTDTNLNRSFTSEVVNKRVKINPEAEIVSKIIDLMKGATFVIDVHDMPGSKLALSSILTKSGNRKTTLNNLTLINCFGPAIYWEEDFDVKKIRDRYKGTINNYLNSVNIPNFSIETSFVEFLSFRESRNIARKIIGLCSLPTTISKRTLRIMRVEQYTPVAGIFIPGKVQLMRAVKKGELLGRVISFNKEKKVIAEAGGYLIRLSSRRFVKNGEKILDIGVKK